MPALHLDFGFRRVLIRAMMDSWVPVMSAHPYAKYARIFYIVSRLFVSAAAAAAVGAAAQAAGRWAETQALVLTTLSTTHVFHAV